MTRGELKGEGGGLVLWMSTKKKGEEGERLSKKLKIAQKDFWGEMLSGRKTHTQKTLNDV